MEGKIVPSLVNFSSVAGVVTGRRKRRTGMIGVGSIRKPLVLEHCYIVAAANRQATGLLFEGCGAVRAEDVGIE